MRFSFCVILFISFFFKISAQNNLSQLSYEDLREHYSQYTENSCKAFIFLQKFISKAKQENNFKKLSSGYIDAIYYSKNHKLKYADSAIITAKESKANALIARAFLAKGSVYSFIYKKYKLALNEYLLANQYILKTNDDYLKKRISYQLAVVKSYLGYDEEALQILEPCLSYFELGYRNKNFHPNLIYNYQKGYLNCIHQLINSYYKTGNFHKVDSLLIVGLNHTPSTEDFSSEQSNFFKWEGIRHFDQNSYYVSLKYLNKALPAMEESNDFAQTSLIYFYLGKNYLALNKRDNSTIYFKKIDSVFNKENFILPEVRNTYMFLIEDAKQKENAKEELYYVKQLLKADNFYLDDFKYISKKIVRGYDTQNLLKEKRLLTLKNYRKSIYLISAFIVIILLCIIIYWKSIRERKIRRQYLILKDKIAQPIANQEKRINSYVSEISNDILAKLINFEEQKKFLDPGLTLSKLAKNLKTNTTYLSQIINEHKGLNFNQYINTLRIDYISHLIYNDNKYLNLTIEALAEKSGFKSRYSFSNVFYQINKIRPSDFVKNRRKEVLSEKNV